MIQVNGRWLYENPRPDPLRQERIRRGGDCCALGGIIDINADAVDCVKPVIAPAPDIDGWRGRRVQAQILKLPRFDQQRLVRTPPRDDGVSLLLVVQAQLDDGLFVTLRSAGVAIRSGCRRSQEQAQAVCKWKAAAHGSLGPDLCTRGNWPFVGNADDAEL